MSTLLTLDLSHLSSVTDEALRPLEMLHRLKWLSLKGTAITDQGIEIITKFRSLTSLNTSQTQVTQDGVLRLKAALPDCSITYKEGL